MTHQIVSLGKYWKLFPTTLNRVRVLGSKLPTPTQFFWEYPHFLGWGGQLGHLFQKRDVLNQSRVSRNISWNTKFGVRHVSMTPLLLYEMYSFPA